MPFITVRDLRMYYELRGTGPRLLGIGGTGGDLRRFPTVFEMLPTQGFETLAGLRVGDDEPGRQAGARRQLEARARHDTFERLPLLRMPVYICGGRYDGIATPAGKEGMQKQIPGSRLELFEGRHLFFIQDPRTVERIRAFLWGKLDD